MMNNFANIPQALKSVGHFCVWKYKQGKNGRMDKIPYNPKTDDYAKTNNPDTFSDFQTAYEVFIKGGYDGLGVGIFNGIGAIDIDHCVTNGKLSELAQDIVSIMNTYTEYSPSGTGIRILFSVNDLAYDKADYYINKHKIGLEVYIAKVTKKYVTVTGNLISSGDYGDRTAELHIVLDKYMKRNKREKLEKICAISPRNFPHSLSDNEVLSKARAAKNGAKFIALYSGDITQYVSPSEADLALCSMLAFWCRCDGEQIDRLFRGSGLYREKWNRAQAGTTYGQNTIETAIKSCADIYNPDFKHSGNSTPVGSGLKPDDFTDVGQARILAREYGNELRFSLATNWLLYSGGVWKEEEIKVHGVAQDLTDRQLKEALAECEQAKKNLIIAEMNGDKQKEEEARAFLKSAKKYLHFIISCRDSRKISAIIKEAQPMLEVEIEQLDTNPFKLNTPIGTVDLQTGQLFPHNPLDFCTKTTAVSLTDEGAELFTRFLNGITCGDKSLEAYLQLVAGMAIVGRVFSENLIIAYGDGRNGKSTFFNLLARVIGDYSGSLSAEILTVNCRKNKGPEYAELRGKRLIIAAELEEGMRLDTAIVKKLCSTDPIYAEKKYKDPFSFTPSHTVVLYTNHLPRVGTLDSGTWRRLIVIPFNAVISDNEDIKNFAEYLFQKAGGAALAWIVEGARKFIAAGHKIDPPECVKQAIENYRRANDWVSSYIFERCAVDKAYKEEAGKLYKDYREYCSRIGDYTRSNADFRTAVEGAGYVWKRTKTGRFFHGLRLLEDSQLGVLSPTPQVMSAGDGEIQDFSEAEVVF